MPSFAETVAARSEHSLDRVKEVLDTAGIEAQPTAAAPVPLQLTRLSFSGVKHREGRDDEPFEFEQSFGAGLWVITSEPNLMGKSTILRLIEWAMTGRAGELTADVRSWITRVELEGIVGDDQFAIRFDNDDGAVTGALTTGFDATFDQDTFAEVTESFFMERLGFDSTPFWQKRVQGLEDEGDASRHGWAAYFAAIHLPPANPKVLLGQRTEGGLPTTLLQVFLGLPWARTIAVARVADNRARMQRSAAQRRAAEDTEVRRQQLEPLAAELEAARASLAQLETQTADATPAAADAAFEAFTAALAEQRSASDTVAKAEAALALAKSDRDEAHKRAQALREAAVVRPLMGHLAPSMCPRCETAVTAERREHEETTGACSVCSEPLHDLEVDEAELAEAETALETADRDFEEAEQVLESARRAEAAARTAHSEAAQGMARIEEAKPVQQDVRGLETKIARIEGQLANTGEVELQVVDDSAGEIIADARKVAEELRGKAAEGLLAELGAEIRALGQRFGIVNLEEVRVTLNAGLKLLVGGADTTFGAVDPGERLRLRLATVIALIRVGKRSGFGRHPGTLLIDTPGGEEMVDEDVAAILDQFNVLADETDGLQIICATARAAQVRDLLDDEERIIHGPDYGELW